MSGRLVDRLQLSLSSFFRQSAIVIVKETTHRHFFFSIQYFVERAEYDRDAARFVHFFRVDLVHISVGICDKRQEELMILLLDCVVKRSCSALVKNIEVKGRLCKLVI